MLSTLTTYFFCNIYFFHNLYCLFCAKIRIIFVTLHCLSRQTFENYRESASLLVKSPNLTKGYARHGDSSYTWAAYPCVYPGVWRCLQECMEGSPLSITNNIVKLFDWLPVENSCKIRQNEKSICYIVAHLLYEHCRVFPKRCEIRG